MTNTITIACWRATNDHANTPSARLAELIATPRFVRQTTLVEFFKRAFAHGADTADLKKIYQYAEYKRDVQVVFEQSGKYPDLSTVEILIALMPFDVSQATSRAITLTVAEMSVRLVDVVAEELNTPAPTTVSADDVDAALERA